MISLRNALAIINKDIVAELHSKEMISAMLVFAALQMLIFSFALDLPGGIAKAAAPGVLWATVIFAGTLGLSRSLAREQENRCIDGLLLAPMGRSVVFVGKAVGNWLFMGLVQVMLLPLFAVLFDAPVLKPSVLLVLALGTLGYASVGTLIAAIAVNTRAREVMLPVLLLPLAIPVLISAVQATGGLMGGGSLTDIGGWVRVMVVYNLVITAVSLVTFGYVLEE